MWPTIHSKFGSSFPASAISGSHRAQGRCSHYFVQLFWFLLWSKINRNIFVRRQKVGLQREVGMVYSDTAFRGSSAVLILIACLAWSSTLSPAQGTSQKTASTTGEAGLAAWQQVYSVLTTPRCINCHTATNYPEQGDDRHRHLFNVVRGPGGKGVPGLNCATCHQSANADSTGVPGAYNWHLAPLSMKWQDTHRQHPVEHSGLPVSYRSLQEWQPGRPRHRAAP